MNLSNLSIDEKKDLVIYFGTRLCDIMVICFNGYKNRVTGCSAIIDLHSPIFFGGGIDAGRGSYNITTTFAKSW